MFATSGRMPACATFRVKKKRGSTKENIFCQWLWTFAIGNFITTCSSNSVISCWFFSSCGPAWSLSQAPFRGLVENGDVHWAGSGLVVWSVMGTGTLLLPVCLFKRLLELPVVSYACHNSFLQDTRDLNGSNTPVSIFAQRIKEKKHVSCAYSAMFTRKYLSYIKRHSDQFMSNTGENRSVYCTEFK